MNGFPRVALPGVDREQADALQAEIAASSLRRAHAFLSLSTTGRHIYAGTVSAKVIAERRRKSKAARRARRVARLAS